MNKKLVYLLQLTTIAALCLIIISNLRSRVQADNTATENPLSSVPSIMLIAETSQNSLLTIELVQNQGVKVVTVPDLLIQETEMNSEIQAIYLDASMIDEIDDDWLRDQYRDGKFIIGINIPMSVLGKMINVKPEIDDLKLEYADGRMAVVAYHAHYENGIPKYQLEHSDFYSDFAIVTTMVKHALRQASTPDKPVK